MREKRLRYDLDTFREDENDEIVNELGEIEIEENQQGRSRPKWI